jgi:hypothetical protein
VPRRYFSLDEARTLIPRIRTQLGTALQLHAHLRAAIADLDGDEGTITFGMLRGEEELDDADDDEAAILERARLLYSALRETVEGIEATGAEVKGVVDGLVDFYSWKDGTDEVLLCWKLGESDITHYHDLEGGFEQRRSLGGHRFLPNQTSADATTANPAPPTPSPTTAGVPDLGTSEPRPSKLG